MKSLCIAAIITLTFNLSMKGQIKECSQKLSAVAQKKIIEFVVRKYKLPSTVTLSLKGDERFRDSCIRELTFEGQVPLKNWELTMYASSGGRYLSSDIFDTAKDPVLEEHEKELALTNHLVSGATATWGSETAPVTIVESSDFECPYCKSFASLLTEVLGSEGRDVRVVFRHLPLSIHPWARQAAETAGCVQLQGSSAFWKLQDLIFASQESISTANVGAKLRGFAEETGEVDLSSLMPA